MIRRELITPYLLVVSGLIIGLYVGVFVVNVEPAIIGWLFGAGAGVTFGAFVAAISSDEPLVGRGALPTPSNCDSYPLSADIIPEEMHSSLECDDEETRN